MASMGRGPLYLYIWRGALGPLGVETLINSVSKYNSKVGLGAHN
jgi:hypothetical protein